MWCLVLFGFQVLLPFPCALAGLMTLPPDFLHNFGRLSILSDRVLHKLQWKVISIAPMVDLEGNLG